LIRGERRIARIGTAADRRGSHDRAFATHGHAPSCGVGAPQGPAQFALAEPRRVGAAVRWRQLRPTLSRRIPPRRSRSRVCVAVAPPPLAPCMRSWWARRSPCGPLRIPDPARLELAFGLEEPWPASSRPLALSVARKAPPRRLQPDSSYRPTPPARALAPTSIGCGLLHLARQDRLTSPTEGLPLARAANDQSAFRRVWDLVVPCADFRQHTAREASVARHRIDIAWPQRTVSPSLVRHPHQRRGGFPRAERRLVGLPCGSPKRGARDASYRRLLPNTFTTSTRASCVPGSCCLSGSRATPKGESGEGGVSRRRVSLRRGGWRRILGRSLPHDASSSQRLWHSCRAPRSRPAALFMRVGRASPESAETASAVILVKGGRRLRSGVPSIGGWRAPRCPSDLVSNIRRTELAFCRSRGFATTTRFSTLFARSR